jgi:hypothetical protein
MKHDLLILLNNAYDLIVSSIHATASEVFLSLL